MTMKNISSAARDFITQNADQHLGSDRPRLVSRCVSFLIDEHDANESQAIAAAMLALQLHDCAHVDTSIDCSRSTSFTLVMSDHLTGKKEAFSIDDLRPLIDARRVSAATL